MSVLTKKEILKQIKKGNIKIEPLNIGNIDAASIDLTLSNKFRVFKKTKEVCDVKEDVDYKKYTKLVRQDSIVLKPGEMVLGITKEKITMPTNMCGFIEGRSRFARLGMTVHVSAPLVQPGVSNHQVLEIINLGSVHLRLHTGEKICQLVFKKTIGRAKYTGKFAEQTEP